MARMALINCPDCSKEVSSKAPACPNCGSPISIDTEASGSGVHHLTTTQETSKKFKLQTLISVLLMIIGGVWVIVLSSEPDALEQGDMSAPTWMLTIGVIWYLVNRFRIWWHHK